MGILNHNNSGEVAAGDLWQFFHSQGVQSLDRLTLCLDVEQLEGHSAFDLKSVELKIEDPNKVGYLLTNVSLGNNSIVVPGLETSSSKPEAKLEIVLGYDFMERFSAASKEKIKLDFSANSDMASKATFSIGSNEEIFSSASFVLLALFVGFWVAVFFVLNRVTKPIEQESLVDVGFRKTPAATATSVQAKVLTPSGVEANSSKRALSA